MLKNLKNSLDLPKITPPQICEEGPSGPGSPITNHKQILNFAQQHLMTMDAMQRINFFSDYETDTDTCNKDLLSPYSALSPSPFQNSCDGYPEPPETPYSGYISNDGRSPLLSPLPFNSSSLNFHFNFDPHQRSVSSMSNSRFHDESSGFTQFLQPHFLDGASRERSRSEGEMLAEQISHINEQDMKSTLSVPATRHQPPSKMFASTSIKSKNRIRNCYSPQGHYFDKALLNSKLEQIKRSSSALGENEMECPSTRSSSTPPPTLSQHPNLSQKDPGANLFTAKSALDLSKPNTSQLQKTPNINWLEAQLEAWQRASSMANVASPVFSHILAMSMALQSNGLLLSKSHSETNVASCTNHVLSPFVNNLQINGFLKESGKGTTKPTHFSPTKMSEVQATGAIPIDCQHEAFICNWCGQAFALADRLAKHIASRHKDKSGTKVMDEASKIHKCKVCGKGFSRSDMLTRHNRLHSGVKPYSCTICGQVFSRSDHLTTHIRVHSGEKPYKCRHCNYAASRRDMITRHMKTHTTTQVDGGMDEGGVGAAEMMARLNLTSAALIESAVLGKGLIEVPTISLSTPMDGTESAFGKAAHILFQGEGK
uniref:Zinc finger, C2H2 type n=1 Tax=Rhabditophanes sp. KR3021 TaxID=114890 RepID=A0AC35UA54_9BILA